MQLMRKRGRLVTTLRKKWKRTDSQTTLDRKCFKVTYVGQRSSFSHLSLQNNPFLVHLKLLHKLYTLC
ncbi:hypothetical protein EB796_021855 [Bugula neritina]|uniref:Uncharacterized protein n=1 Tax=Bugula neritina TaxID=10212 RepID=A0A7J7J251_BUGNE|nr:hypothetical protein EB796_021855 [Bugula neritina]